MLEDNPKTCHAAILRPSQLATYRRALRHLVEAHDRLATIKTSGWTQCVLLHDIYQQIEIAAALLIELYPSAVTPHVRDTVTGWTE